MKKMFIKVFMNDDMGESFDIHEEEVAKIECDLMLYLKTVDFEPVFYYHQAAYYGDDFVEISYEDEISDDTVTKLCDLLKNITIEGGIDQNSKELTLNLKPSLKYINFIKLDKCIKI